MNVSGSTKVFGVFGDPVAHSMSPYMQTVAMIEMGFDGVYVPFHVRPERLEHAVRAVIALGMRGVNVTVPHKTAVVQFLDNLTDAACVTGAVNTIINDDGVLTGDNTDVYGFVQGLLHEEGVDAFPERVCIIGAGGAARGIVYGCATRPEVMDIIILNRTVEKALRLAGEFAVKTGKRVRACQLDTRTLEDELPKAGLVINATSIGMHPRADDTPVPDPSLFHSGQIVYDIIMPPPVTRLRKEASLHGARTVGGLAMLALQGARSLSLWTGREAPEEFMISTLMKLFEGKKKE